MPKKQAPGSGGTRTLVFTRRDVLAMGAAAATSLCLPLGFIRTARAQTSSEQYNESVIGQLPDFYISPSGTGNASTGGTATDPWPITMLNDPTAISRYVGKVIGLMDGTYSLYDIMGLPPAGNFSGGNRLGVVPGTAAQPTIIVSQSPQGAIIDGQRDAIYAADPTLDWGEGLLGPTTYLYGYTGAGITIDGLKFVGANYRCITNYGGYGRGGNGNNGCDNLTVRNCWFADQSYITCQVPGKNAAMFYSEGQNHIYVQNCRFDQGSSPSDGNREALIQFYSPTQDTIVESCTCTAPPANAIGIYWKTGPTPGHQGAVSRYNYVDCSLVTALGGSPPIMTDGCTITTDTLQIYNNVLIAALGAPAIWFDTSGVGGYQGTWEFHDNTIVGNWSSKGMIYSTNNWGIKPTAVNFYNNIVAPSLGGGQAGDFQVPAISEIGEVNYNLYPVVVHFGVGNISTYATLASWQSATSTAGHAADANSAQGIPLFVGSGTEAAYYQLASGSPALKLAADGGEIGAWRGASQIGSTIGGGPLPDAPQVSVS
jgi:hypothetical protein